MSTNVNGQNCQEKNLHYCQYGILSHYSITKQQHSLRVIVNLTLSLKIQKQNCCGKSTSDKSQSDTSVNDQISKRQKSRLTKSS